MNINPLIFRYFDGEYFEQLVMEIYSYFGYYIKKTATTGDQGVDLIMINGDEKIAVQCKRYKKNINNRAIQEVFSGMYFYNCNKAMVVTSSAYTHGARKLASALNVILIDGDDLSEIFQSNNNFIGNHFFESEQLTQMIINAGCDLLECSQYNEAINLLTEVIYYKDKFLNKNKSDLLNAHNYLALSYRRIGNDKKAEEVFLQALSIDNNSTILNNLAVLYRDIGKYEEAIKYLEQIDIGDSFYSHAQSQINNIRKII